MSKCSRFWRFQLTLSLAIVSVSSAIASANTESARLATFDSSTGETSFALSLTPELRNDLSVPGKVVIFVDTSASQTAAFREDSLKAVQSVLNGLDAKDQVQLFAVDIDPVALTKGFVAADSGEVKVALKRLSERVPLGSTDLTSMLEQSAKILSGDQQNKNVVYIGDGISRSSMIGTDGFSDIIKNLVSEQISVSSFAIGPERDVELLAALANHTGGNVFIDTDDVGSCDQAAAGLVTTIRGTVFWPTGMQKPAQMTEVFPAVVPPLRADRDTILIGSLSERGEFEVTISGTVNGQAKQFSWPVSPEVSDQSFKFLPMLLDAARENSGSTLATVGSAGLREMARVILASSHQITQLGASVLNASASEVVQEEDKSAAAAEPSAPANEVVPSGGGLNLVDQDFDDEQFLQEQSGAPDYLDKIQAQSDATEQRLRAYMNNELRIVRGLLNTKPDQGIDRLKAMLDTIMRAPDLEPAVRQEMENRMRSALRQASIKKQEFDANLALVERARSVEQVRLDLIKEFEDRQDRIAIYFEQFNSLMDERNFDGALAVINEAASIAPNSPDTAAAEEFSILKVNWDKYWEIRELKNRNFLDTMYEVEKSAIAFPGNPPLSNLRQTKVA
jgi:hypothetical protein